MSENHDWTEEDEKKPWGCEAAFLRKMADHHDSVEIAAMLRHCAKRIESTSGISLRTLADMLDPAKQAGVLREVADGLACAYCGDTKEERVERNINGKWTEVRVPCTQCSGRRT